MDLLVAILLLGLGIAIGRFALSRITALSRLISPNFSIATINQTRLLSLLMMVLAGFLLKCVAALPIEEIAMSTSPSTQPLRLLDKSVMIGNAMLFPVFSLLLGGPTIGAILLHRINLQRSAGKTGAGILAIWPSARTCMMMLWVQLLFLLIGFAYYIAVY